MTKLNKEQQKEREQRVWSLRSRGYTHERIAAEMGVDRTTITKLLQRLSVKASLSLISDVVEEKYAQVALLRHVIEEAMDGWERSKQSAKTMTTKTTVGAGGEGGASQPKDATVKVADQDGDTRYLSEARSALADIRKLLGLDSPSKLMNINLENLNDDQLQRIANGEDPMIVVMGM